MLFLEEKMKFSVILTVYNVEQYLEECLESILIQDFKDYEIILVNDGSKDASGQICDRYKELYPEIFIVNHIENIGSLIARRIGFSLSKGEYILFLDSDDKIRRDSLSLLYNTIEDTGSDLIIFNHSRLPDFSTKVRNYEFKGNEFIDKQKMYKNTINSNNLNTLWSKCVQRDLVDIEEDYSVIQWISVSTDIVQALPIVDQCSRPYHLDESLYYYRVNRKSISYTYKESTYKSQVFASKLTRTYAEKWDVNFRPKMIAIAQPLVVIVKSNLPINEKKKLLHEILKDEYFQYAYKTGYRQGLSVKVKVFLALCMFFHKMKLL